MRKDQSYLLTLAGLTLTVLVISIFTVNHLFSESKDRILLSQLEVSKREAREVARLLEQQLASGVSHARVTLNLQRSIENTDTQSGFLCMYDTNGIELCHPNPKRIGQPVDSGSVVEGMNDPSLRSFYELLSEGQATGGMRSIGPNQSGSEIIYMHPVRGTGWMVAAHANIVALNQQMSELRDQFLLTHGLAGALIVLLSFVTVRWVGHRYERGLESEKAQLVDDVKGLSKLNADLLSYQRKLEQAPVPAPIVVDAAPEEEKVKKDRILTYWRDQLVPVATEDIAFIHTQHALTYINCLDGQVYTSNGSLDELYSQLDERQFFRANRQFVVSVRAIDKIFRYGRGQLKIAVHPKAPTDILISKNKAAEFKQWLDS